MMRKEVEILCLNRIKKGKELEDGNLWPELDSLGKMPFTFVDHYARGLD